MEFPDPEIEKAYRLKLNLNKFYNDLISLILGCGLIFIPFLKIWITDREVLKNGPTVYVIIFAAVALLMFYFITRQSVAFIMRRHMIILLFQISNAFCYYWFVVRSPGFNKHILQLAMPTTTLGRIFHLNYFPLLLLRTCFAHSTTVSVKRYILLAVLVLCLISNWNRCQQEINKHPEQGIVYNRIITTLETFSTFLLPFSSSITTQSKSVFSTTASALTGQHACIVAHGIAQYTIGFAIPLSIVSTEEFLSRKAHEIEIGLGPGLALKYPSLLFFNTALVPFQAAVALATAIWLFTMYENLYS